MKGSFAGLWYSVPKGTDVLQAWTEQWMGGKEGTCTKHGQQEQAIGRIKKC